MQNEKQRISVSDFCAGIDIGGTNTVVGLVDQAGYCAESVTVPTDPDFEKHFRKIADAIRRMKEKYPDRQLRGIGMGAPDANHYTGMIVSPPNLHWKDANIVREMKKYFDLPVAVTNDANAAAIGEKLYGAASEMNHFVLITLGTGLGSGIVINGKILHGTYGYAGEVGHITAVPGGRLCGCGKRGCLETYVSATGIRRTAIELLAEFNRPSRIAEIAPEKLTSEQIFELAKQGDELAEEAFRKTGEMLGQKLADVVAVIEPEAIFLFGGPARAGELLLDPARRAFEENLLPVYRGKIKLLLSGLMDKNVAVLGAAALIRDEMDKK